MKAVFSYILVLFSAVSYAFLFDRGAGSIMTVFLIVVPAVSVFLTLFSLKKLHFELNVQEKMLKKKCRSRFSLHVVKDTFLPLPVLSFEVMVSEHFQKPEYDVYRFSMSENREMNIDIDIMPEICGNALLKARKFYITDYLGIFRFKIRIPEISESVIIIPEIHETDRNSDILYSIYQTLPDNDDDENSALIYGRAAVPGYEYRSYVPGDPLKKINWKLSSKRNQLYVRTDESGGITLPNIILDVKETDLNTGTRSDLCVFEQFTEGSLSLVNECIKNGIECCYIYPRSGNMYTEQISSSEDIERVASEIFRYMNEPVEICFQNEKKLKSSEVNIVFTSGISEKLAGEAEVSVSEGNSVKVVVPEQVYSPDMLPVPELWLQREDFSVFRLQ